MSADQSKCQLCLQMSTCFQQNKWDCCVEILQSKVFASFPIFSIRETILSIQSASLLLRCPVQLSQLTNDEKQKTTTRRELDVLDDETRRFPFFGRLI
mmetsp:Transcript_11893/g.26170  ORF Transcript_11893/g.26170 Transcript_11893/m.26170 type:complete len:98 (-) Transcript_11893:92-385(-)